jgi:hypothetical protein
MKMSYVIDAAGKVNEVQLKVVTEGQDAVVELVKKVTAYVDRAPEAPEAVQKLLEPFEGFVGTPAELVESIAQANNEWAANWLDFHNRISEVLAPVAQSAAAKPTPIKKSGSARKAKV